MAGKKILIADYDRASLNALVEIFEEKGLDVIAAKDGEAAYKLYKEEEPALVLLEAMLPKIHGFDLTGMIHEESEGRVPVVIVTGLYKDEEHKTEALRSFGASDYFEKPYDKDLLVEAVMKLLREEQDIDEELPSPEDVVGLLKKQLRRTQGG